MNPIGNASPLSNMLDKAFQKVDKNQDGSLDKKEFSTFYEVLKPGIAKNLDNSYRISEPQEFSRMDHNGDGQISDSEMQNTPVLMPADLCSDSLGPMVQYLLQQKTASATEAANLLMPPDDSKDKDDKTPGPAGV